MDQNKLINFLAFWVVDAVIILLADAIFAKSIVLGNSKISPSLAAVFAGFILSAVFYLLPGAVEKLELKIKNIWALMGVNFIAYAVIIWIVKRFALITGLGIANNLYVAILAAVVTVVGWQLEAKLKSVLKKA